MKTIRISVDALNYLNTLLVREMRDNAKFMDQTGVRENSPAAYQIASDSFELGTQVALALNNAQ